MTNAFTVARRDTDFLLWEQFKLQEHAALAEHWSKSELENILADTQRFAETVLAPSNSRSDREECHLDADGHVVTPSDYPELFAQYKQFWKGVEARSKQSSDIPEPVQYLAKEAVMGANPSFITYVGFNQFAVSLLKRFATPEQYERYAPLLNDFRATACLCLTEQDAGTDLTRLACVANPLPSGRYAISGHKWLISAGMHELSENIIYFVLARAPGSAGMLGLSCFIVPRWRVTEGAAASKDNFVRCREVVEKMGFHGCANTLLTFGEDGVCEAELLGASAGQGLRQLMYMMVPARISTGIFALGIAGAAYGAAQTYASQRIQGKRFDQSLSPQAPSLVIKEHADVQRMLLDMAARTSGCRALVAYLGEREATAKSTQLTARERTEASHIVDLLTPVVKAYISDQAWRVCETAIQVYGGAGYLRQNPVEQCARDAKILSIWEGTNHMQSQYLVRDILGLGARADKLNTLLEIIIRSFAHRDIEEEFPREAAVIREVSSSIAAALGALDRLVRQGKINQVPFFTTEFQAGLGDLLISWLLLEGARTAHKNSKGCDAGDANFYQTKISVARYFCRFQLPRTLAGLMTLSEEIDLPMQLKHA